MVAIPEITAARDRSELQSPPIIFTKDLFQIGLSTLINAVTVHLSQDPKPRPQPIQLPAQPTTAFELMLDGNELWVKVNFENQTTEKFYVQKFHEGSDPEGSPLFKFVKGIIKNPQAGERKADLLYRWESASKHINRLQLPEELKQAFFGKSYSSTFRFKGISVQLPTNEGEVIAKLRERHLKSGIGGFFLS